MTEERRGLNKKKKKKFTSKSKMNSHWVGSEFIWDIKT